MWLDASATSTVHTSGGVIDSWDSKVGSFAVSATTTLRPAYSGTLNGLNVATSDATTNQTLTGTPGLLNSVSAWSIFAVVEPTQNTVAACPIMVVSNSGTNGRAFFFTTTTDGFWEGAGRRLGSDSASVTLSSTVAANNVWKYISLISSYTSTTQTLYVNGSQVAQNVSWCSSGNTDATGGTVTVFNNAVPNLPWKGSIAEILIYNSALGTTDRQSVETYLASKWGL